MPKQPIGHCQPVQEGLLPHAFLTTHGIRHSYVPFPRETLGIFEKTPLAHRSMFVRARVSVRGPSSAVRRPSPVVRRPSSATVPLGPDRGPEREKSLCYRGGSFWFSFPKEWDRLASRRRHGNVSALYPSASPSNGVHAHRTPCVTND